MFNEDAKWDWNTEAKTQEKIPIEVAEDSVLTPSGTIMPNNNDGAICSDDHGTTPRNNNSSSTISSSFSEEETPVSKVRTLRELYKSCSYAFSVMDPVTYEEAATKKE